MHRIAPVLLFVVASALASVEAVRADQADEYSVTIAMLYSFARFVDWSHNSFTDDLRFCITENSRFAERSRFLLESRKIANRSITIVDVDRYNTQLTNCNLLYIPSERSSVEEQLLQQVAHNMVLTIGESEDFIQNGGVISLFVDNNRLRFEIDANNARQQLLTISSQLLQLSRKRP